MDYSRKAIKLAAKSGRIPPATRQYLLRHLARPPGTVSAVEQFGVKAVPPPPSSTQMDVNAELPPDLEWYKDQIAGHHPSVIRNGVRQIGILKEKGRDQLILKLAQDGVRGEREIALYRRTENVANGSESEANNFDLKTNMLLLELHKFLPRFYGCRKIRLTGKDIPKEFLQLEDITHPFRQPCIMDIKVGRVTYDPFASDEKKKAEDSKSPLQKILGFRILGYRVHTERGTRYRDRVWGRERTEENIQQAFEEYLIHARPEAALEVLDGFLERLLAIRDWFERQSILHFYASSVLLVYEGHAKLPPAVDIRMIDFSHVFPTVETGIQERDENYLYGLNKIIELFSQIRKELTQRASNGNHEDSQKN